MKAKFKTILLLTLIFVAGVAVGVIGTRIAVKKWIASASNKTEIIQRGIERDLKRKLNLRPDQQAALHDITTRAVRDMKTLRAEFQPKLDEVVAKSEEQLRLVLDESQKLKFDEVRRERAARRQRIAQ